MSDSESISPPRDSAVAVWTLVVAIMLAAIYFLQLDTMQRQLGETRRQTRLSQRPWIGLSDEGALGGLVIVEPLHFDAKGDAQMLYKTVAKNFGSYGAQGVTSISQLIVGTSPSQTDEHGICEGIPHERGYAIYPGKASPWNESPSSYAAKNIKKNAVGETTAYIIGCIVFRDQFDCRYDLRFGYNFVDNRYSNNVPMSFPPTPNSTPEGHFALHHSEMDSPPCPEQDGNPN